MQRVLLKKSFRTWALLSAVQPSASTGFPQVVLGCPYCAGQKPSVTNSLASLFPEISMQWHRTKNDLGPHDVAPASHKKIWWQCPNGPDHEWQATVASRTQENATGCPYCAGKKVS